MKRKFILLETGHKDPDTSSEHSHSSHGEDTTRPPSISPPTVISQATSAASSNFSNIAPPITSGNPLRQTLSAPSPPPPQQQYHLQHPIFPVIGPPFHPSQQHSLPPHPKSGGMASTPPTPATATAIPRPPSQLPPFRRILVINPNNSLEMTNTMRTMVRPPPGTMVQYYTTADGPPSIDGARTSIQSAAAALAPLIQSNALNGHEGFLVACFSAHPLVECLRELTSKPVVGIFQASIFYALTLGGRFGIVTTNQRWDYILTKSVHDLIGPNPSFGSVICTGYSAAEVHGETSRNQVQRAMAEAALKLVQDDHCDVIILGCAGMTGLESIVREAVGKDVTIIDAVLAGVHMLAGLIHSGLPTSGAGAYG
jgi:Asp/Glu/hydantoin racemase